MAEMKEEKNERKDGEAVTETQAVSGPDPGREEADDDTEQDTEILRDDEWEYESYEDDPAPKTDREIRREESHPMFETETVYTYEEYLRYYKMLENRISHVWWKRGAMVALVVVFVTVMKMRGYGSIGTMVTLIALAVFLPLLFEVMQRRILKKRFEKDDNRDLVAHIRMYEDHFSQSSRMGDSHFLYSDIYRIIETKTNFYIMQNRYQGLILVKENCSRGMLDAVMDIWNQMEGGSAGTAKYDPSKDMQSGKK